MAEFRVIKSNIGTSWLATFRGSQRRLPDTLKMWLNTRLSFSVCIFVEGCRYGKAVRECLA
jgi:hypothetical protein